MSTPEDAARRIQEANRTRRQVPAWNDMDTVAEAYLACAAQLRLLTQQLQDSPTRPLAEFIAEQKATPAYQAAKAAERRSAAMEAQLRLFANDSNAPDYVRYYSRLVLGMIAPDGSTR